MSMFELDIFYTHLNALTLFWAMKKAKIFSFSFSSTELSN